MEPAQRHDSEICLIWKEKTKKSCIVLHNLHPDKGLCYPALCSSTRLDYVHVV